MSPELLIMTTLIVKHFVADALLQFPYQYLNKGKFLHPGGLLHAGIHGILTAYCFMTYSPEVILIVASIDTVLHYFIDYAKMNISAIFKWSEYDAEDGKSFLKIYDNNFFIILILDQCLHMMTYVLLIGIALAV